METVINGLALCIYVACYYLGTRRPRWSRQTVYRSTVEPVALRRIQAVTYTAITFTCLMVLPHLGNPLVYALVGGSGSFFAMISGAYFDSRTATHPSLTADEVRGPGRAT